MLFNLALISEKASSKRTFFSKKFVPCPFKAEIHAFRGSVCERQPHIASGHFVGVATLSGLEPELSGPKPLVLPLHHRVTKKSILYFSTFSRKFQLKALKRTIFVNRSRNQGGMKNCESAGTLKQLFLPQSGVWRRERNFAATASAMASGVKPCSSRIFVVEPCGMISSASQP